MKILTAAMVRNEAGRFLSSALDAWMKFSDEVFVLDDVSEDNSAELARSAGAEVLTEDLKAWGDEAPARKRLWDEAQKRTKVGDYIFILDADMVPSRDPRPLLSSAPSSVCFPLYDLWAEYSDGMLMYRSDNYWRGHTVPRPWIFKRVAPPPEGWEWPRRGIHCGHAPLNYPHSTPVFAPKDYAILHYAYIRPELRSEKAKQYVSVRAHLTPGEIAHARSILDPIPQMQTLPFEPELRLWTP